jgi:hypothetical protein
MGFGTIPTQEQRMRQAFPPSQGELHKRGHFRFEWATKRIFGLRPMHQACQNNRFVCGTTRGRWTCGQTTRRTEKPFVACAIDSPDLISESHTLGCGELPFRPWLDVEESK